MSQLTAPTFAFAPGDTWVMPVTYRGPDVVGLPGGPIILTGCICTAILFTRGHAAGLPLTGTVNAAAGVMTFTVDESTTAPFVPDVIKPFADRTEFPTRLQVRVRDTLGNIETIAVFPIQVYDPRTVDVSTLPTWQAGVVVAGQCAADASPLTAARAKVVKRTIGDTWSFAYTYTGPPSAPGSPGSAIILSATTITPLLYLAAGAAPVTLALSTDADTNLALGKFKPVAPPALTATATADQPDATDFPTRLVIVLTDSTGAETTLSRQPINVLAR